MMDRESGILRESYACLQIDVEKRDSHYLSQSEIVGGKRISQHLSKRECLVRSDLYGFIELN